MISGLESWSVTEDNLKNFGAAFATTSAVPMFHIAGVTPEAATYEQAIDGISPDSRTRSTSATFWNLGGMNTGSDPEVGFVSIGTPHASLSEFATLATLVQDRRRTDVPFIITTNRELYPPSQRPRPHHCHRTFRRQPINDTCWCLIDKPIIPRSTRKHRHQLRQVRPLGAAKHSRGMHLRACRHASTQPRPVASTPASATLAARRQHDQPKPRPGPCRSTEGPHMTWSASSSTDRPLIHPLRMEGMAERTVVVGSLSKEHRMIGWRVGWVAGPPDTVTDAGWVHVYNTTMPVAISRFAATAVLRGDQGHVAECVAELERRRDTDPLRPSRLAVRQPGRGRSLRSTSLRWASSPRRLRASSSTTRRSPPRQ